jgi:hypothetical protein
MDIFYIVVLSIATIILILILTYVGIQMSDKQSASTSFPPVANTCPDYWNLATDKKSCLVQSSGRNSISNFKQETVKAGYSAPSGSPQIDFTDAGWSADGNSATCAQKKWAESQSITWDGITNYNKC